MNLKLLHIFLLSTGGTLLLCTPLIHTTELVNGLVIGKMCWFHLVMLFFSVCVFFVVLTKRTTAIAFLSSDLLLLIFTGTVLITYKWSLNPEPEKLIFIGQLVIFWFLLRYILTAYREFNFFFLFVGILTGLVEAVAWPCLFQPFAFPSDGFFLQSGSLLRLSGGCVAGRFVDGVAVSKGDALFRLYMRRSNSDCPACRDEPVGMDGGGCGLRMGVLGGTDWMGKDESCI